MVPSEVTGYETDVYLYPTDPLAREKAAGTKEWLAKAQETWSDKKVQRWRKELVEQGYDQLVPTLKKSGGWGQDLMEALRLYHESRYSNLGEAIPVVPTIDTKRQAKRVVRQTFTDDELEIEVRDMFRESFDDDPDEAELEHWKNMIRRAAMKYARKGRTGADLVSATEAKVTNDFLDDPVVKRHMEFEEENTELADGIAGMAQVLAAL
jgi:hypothetical protein